MFNDAAKALFKTSLDAFRAGDAPARDALAERMFQEGTAAAAVATFNSASWTIPIVKGAMQNMLKRTNKFAKMHGGVSEELACNVAVPACMSTTQCT